MLTLEDANRRPSRHWNISKSGLDFIKGFEMFVPYVYDDLVPPNKKTGKYVEWDGGPVKGTLTIGYGHTDAAKHPLKISKGLRISEATASEILDVDLDDCEQAVRNAVKVPITQGMYDAFVSFTFNCGPGNLKKIADRLNAGNETAARAAFDLYVKSKGKPLRGLQRRRDGEQALWDAVEPAPIEVADTFHPAEVDAPKAKPVIATVRESRSLPALLNGGVVMVAGVFTNALDWASDWVGWAVGVVPDVSTQLQTTMMSGEAVAGALQIPWPKISAAVALSCIGVAFWRELNRKRAA